MTLRAALAATALAATQAVGAPPPQRGFDVAAFFTGRTHADNNLKIVFHRTSKLVVDSVGRMEGTQFVQVDTVHEGDKPVRMRRWVTHEVAPGHYAGTLSDAVGPVDIVVRGDAVTIRYTMKGGLDVFEQLRLQPDGRSLSNHVDARKFGLRFATVEGTIRKLD